MKAIVGTAPNLPWWRLCSMSDDEVEQYNHGHMMEIEMTDEQLSGTAINAKYQAEQAYFRALRENWEKHTWNAAIEAAAKETDKLTDYIGNGLSDRIRKLKK